MMEMEMDSRAPPEPSPILAGDFADFAADYEDFAHTEKEMDQIIATSLATALPTLAAVPTSTAVPAFTSFNLVRKNSTYSLRKCLNFGSSEGW